MKSSIFTPDTKNRLQRITRGDGSAFPNQNSAKQMRLYRKIMGEIFDYVLKGSHHSLSKKQITFQNELAEAMASARVACEQEHLLRFRQRVVAWLGVPVFFVSLWLLFQTAMRDGAPFSGGEPFLLF